ncbi:MAG: putative alpha/beta-hydrolase family hydrolase [Oceanospirillaceae bacterium]|jgi:predicted alpha/beta-hydrolase family hydrolase
MELLIEGGAGSGVVILAHGAGIPMDHPFMQQVSEQLNSIGLQVVRFEFPYMAKRRSTGKKSLPDKLPVLIASFKEVISKVKNEIKAQSNSKTVPIYLAGKSLGGRIATIIACTEPLAGVFVYGYPFHPINKPDRLRVEHLQDINANIYIYQGERDKLGSIDEVGTYALSHNVTVEWLTDGDHDLKPRVRSGFTQQQHMNSILSKIERIIKC